MTSSGGLIVATSGALIGIAPDRDTERDTWAVIVAIEDLHFTYSGAGPGNEELFFQRHCGEWADLMTFWTTDEKPSGALRYPRQGFPWPKDQRPEPLLWTDLGTPWDVVRQVREWPTS